LDEAKRTGERVGIPVRPEDFNNRYNRAGHPACSIGAVMADRPLSIDIRHPLMLKANDLVLLTREDGEIPRPIPGFGLF
jgi:hypothetical protein